MGRFVMCMLRGREFFSPKISRVRTANRRNFSSETRIFKNAKQFAFFKYPAIPAGTSPAMTKYPSLRVDILSYHVAGAGIAPALQGYEPRDVLLVHPAKSWYTSFL